MTTIIVIATLVMIGMMVVARGIELEFGKPSSDCPAGRPSPLEPQKLNFYCTRGIRDQVVKQDFAAIRVKYFADNQNGISGKVSSISSSKKDEYIFRNFKFWPKISKKGAVISSYFQKISTYFQDISNYFEWISKKRDESEGRGAGMIGYVAA